MFFWKLGYTDVNLSKEQKHNEWKQQRSFGLPWEEQTERSQDWRGSPSLEGAEVFMVCRLGDGGFWFRVHGEPQVGRHGSWILSPQPVCVCEQDPHSQGLEGAGLPHVNAPMGWDRELPHGITVAWRPESLFWVLSNIVWRGVLWQWQISGTIL